MKTVISTSGFAQFFGISKHSKVVFDNNTLLITSKHNPSITIHIDKILNFSMVDGIIWDAFEIILKSGTIHSVDGLPKDSSTDFAERFEVAFAEHYYAYWYEKGKQCTTVLPQTDQYFRTIVFHALNTLVDQEMKGFKYLSRKPKSSTQTDLFEMLLKIQRGDSSLQENHNQAFIEKELEIYKSYFDTVEKMPLTEMQRKAVIVNEQANLVVAGAGSGKTSVMVARVGYVMQKYNVKSDEILLLAFNKTAAEELQERIKKRLKLEGVKVSTFHAMGLNVIARTEGVKASVAPWATSEIAKNQLIGELIEDLARKDVQFQETLLHFFAYPFAVYKNEFDFKTEMEYRQYIRENRIVSLKGDEVKSYEECEIANFLFLNQINYKYEAPYEHNTATEEHGQYHPDFYLSDHKIYFEHFGIDEQGNTAPYVDDDAYLEGMVWKRALHRHHNTKLIETYSYQRRGGCLLTKLKEMLESEGVELKPMNFDEALIYLNETGRVNDFTKIVSTFINHYKSNDHTIATLIDRANGDERLLAFIQLFKPILDAYEAHKKAIEVIDFEDMISRATKHIQENKYSSKYRYVLVDEYQDISTSRAKLVRALHQKGNDAVLTVVGDDWQSIYRFAGSDISLFHDFEKYFGHSETVKLDYTFRYNDKLSSVSQKFVEKNPHQIKKQIKTISKAKEPTVNIWWGDEKDYTRIHALIESFVARQEGKPFSVFLLGRTRFSFPEDVGNIINSFPHIDIKITTAHSSKGLEADFVIIVGLSSGRYGFPSTVEDDPILDLVLAEQEQFEFTEERRLFYVAMTRGKQEVHILASNVNISPFAKELEGKEYNVNHHYPDNIQPQECPSCHLGTLVVRSSSNGKKFWGCSNYAKLDCGYTAPISFCSKCQTGIMQLKAHDNVYRCTNKTCNHEDKVCPECGGKLVKRFGKNNRPFFGCSNYFSNKCKYTEMC
ncbi:MAG: UvrD-helicase domain-containing protein [Sulfurimonadaceae bacterium]